jgi:chromosome segregation protein
LLQLKRLHDQVAQVHADLLQRMDSTTKQQIHAQTQAENTRNNNVLIQQQRVALEVQTQELQQEIEKYQKVISQWVEHSEKLDASYKESQKEKDVLTQQRLKQEQVTDSLQKSVFHLREKSQKEQQMDIRTTLAEITQNQQIIFEALDGVLAMEPRDTAEEQMTLPLYVLWADIENSTTMQKWKQRIDQYQTQLQSIGAVNFMAIEERVSIAQEYETVLAQQKDLEDSMQQIVDTIQQLDDICSVRFMETVTAVDAQFRQVYPRLLGGGLSFVEILDPSKPLETGVSIFAQPPGKKLERLSLLSGGERAMVAIALLFSLFSVKPSPVCLLDEVDAPLDEANGERFNTMLQEMSQNSQFIVITHNKKTMEAVDVLYGISMPTPGVSQLVSVRFE